MSTTEQHTKGPWSCRKSTDVNWLVSGPRGNFHVIAQTMQGNDEANARLIAAAPAADLLLQMLRLGLACFDGDTNEFRFDGLRYSTRGSGPDWSKLVTFIGWNKCRAAVARAKGDPS